LIVLLYDNCVSKVNARSCYCALVMLLWLHGERTVPKPQRARRSHMQENSPTKQEQPSLPLDVPERSDWGTSPNEARRRELEERLRSWTGETGLSGVENQSQIVRAHGPFADFRLEGGDVFWLAALSLAGASGGIELAEQQLRESRLNMRRTLVLDGLHLEGADLHEARLAGANLQGAHLEGTNLQNAHLEQAFLRDAHLDYAKLRGAHLERASLGKSQLDHATLTEATLTSATLMGTSLNDISATGANFEGASLQDASLRGARLDRAAFQGAVLREADLESAVCTMAQFTGADCLGARMVKSNLGGATLDQADFSTADLTSATLTDTSLKSTAFVQAILSGAQLQRAVTEGTHFFEAHLVGATLSEADMRGADFENATLADTICQRTNFEGANLNGAYLEGADLRQARLGRAILTRCTCSPATVFDGVSIAASDGIGPRVADAHWNGAILTVADWYSVRRLADDEIATQKRVAGGTLKDRLQRLGELEAAARANTQLGAELMEHVEVRGVYFSARGIHLRRKALWMRKEVRECVSSWLLDGLAEGLAGYGYRPLRSVGVYLSAVLLFAALYFTIGQVTPPQLSPLGAIIFSVTSFHGRGFFPSPDHANLDHPLVVAAAVEAVIGLIIEITFIAVFTKRFFFGR
jgi:uncharacterized protein YjbI with pentapeptide repeats